MYQAFVYGFMTYKIYSEYTDMIHCVKMVSNGVSGLAKWLFTGSSRANEKIDTTHIDWVLILDQEPDVNILSRSQQFYDNKLENIPIASSVPPSAPQQPF